MSNMAHNAKNDPPKVLQYLSSNLRGYRLQAGFSQMALAERSGVSRRMLAGIEAGDRNVSLAVLDKLAAALNLSFTDLVQAPDARGNHLVGELAWQGAQPASQALFVASVPAHQRVELWQWTLMPGEHYDSAPDAAGWREIIYVIAGTLTLVLEQHTLTLAAGETQVFNSDQQYAYANRGDQPLLFIRNVTF
ncbi:anaerobic benzoate catabolism transcriptional regulator [Serratia entomophila]|jgi:transcriptional regulator with XRE-family HTH domain|uniref:Helix-turn-helix transcriptional regulator n=1 Tax=Serratia entomophila TaxID=42906 RepID=A0ABY5D084_9GAMM|nr:XRE family transcriptional regulator [Serratia entomophila]UIW20073.1 XRE family transcriptional regulator [Serratia entomophila]USV03247.1 helix-turn-helix transcriptional regulator [Serratia entomophila]CAI0736682.1 anaerobic benzoate catabolism transcriptional regulator [Serratia entomophila]CAI0746371.1 anaerobic benzoate catabolism transcriptional regulator [Serratia entomophila]CAI0764576.1 anaerobic benzoate catabolism transcriptional regulator [Serratia entomophila]